MVPPLHAWTNSSCRQKVTSQEFESILITLLFNLSHFLFSFYDLCAIKKCCHWLWICTLWCESWLHQCWRQSPLPESTLMIVTAALSPALYAFSLSLGSAMLSGSCLISVCITLVFRHKLKSLKIPASFLHWVQPCLSPSEQTLQGSGLPFVN